MNSATNAPSHSSIPPLAVPLLSLAAFGSGISLRVTDPMLPFLAQEFGVALGQAAHVITVFSIAYGLSQLIFGPVGDRYGKYLVVGLASMACALTALLCALAPGYGLLLGARLLAGATAAAIIPLAMAWIGDVVPYQERQPVIARFLIGQVLGLSSGVLLGGLAADIGNWRLPFFFISAVFVVVSVAILSLNRRLPAHARITHRAEGHALVRMVREFHEVLRLPWARTILLAVLLEGAFLYGAFAFIASHAHVRFGISLTTAGALVMLFGLGGFVFAIASAALVRALGEVRLAIVGGALVALSWAGIGLAPAWGWVTIACFAAGIGFYMMHTTLQINATQMAPERRGAAVSAFASCFFLGQSIGVGTAGLIVEWWGTRAVMLLGAAGVLAVALRFAANLQRR
ncbi:MAG TPA: MFS transporter [Noviherbaspirillum sp.]|nr:MFS transporter [Noviherbaspirillum sp.]